jgi:hypothetical protein
MSELTPQHMLVDLLGSGDFPAQVLDPEAAAWIILRRLFDDRISGRAGRQLISRRKSNVTTPGAAVIRSAPGLV